MTMKRKQKILLSTLLGIILPLGNIIGPLMVKCENSEQRLYRHYVLKSEIIITSLSYVIGVAILLKVHFFSAEHVTMSEAWRWFLIFGLWIMIILFALVNALSLYYKSSQTRYEHQTDKENGNKQ